MKKILIALIKNIIYGFKETFPKFFNHKKTEDFDSYVESLKKGCEPGSGCCGQSFRLD